MMDERHVVTCFLRNCSEVLLLRRSKAVGSYHGQWGGVAGHAEGDPDTAARREIDEETGLADAVTFVRKGESFPVEDETLGIRWIVHPYLFDCTRRDVHLNEETTEVSWVSPAEILRRNTVPQLWTSYRHIAPSVESIRHDREHGSAYLSIRAMEVLRDRSAELDHEGELDVMQALSPLARALLEAHPSMAAIVNRVNRAIHAVRTRDLKHAAAQAIDEAIGQVYRNEETVVHSAAAYVAGRRVFTLSRSGTVIEALRAADPVPSVVIALSGPRNEGVSVAEELSRAGLDVTLIPDAAILYALIEEHVDLVLLGADTVLPNGDVINRTGTYVAALGARQMKIPCYIAAAEDKVSTEGDIDLEMGAPDEVYEGAAIINAFNPLFEVTPAHLVSGYITENGVVAAGEIIDVAYELRSLARWMHDDARYKL